MLFLQECTLHSSERSSASFPEDCGDQPAEVVAVWMSPRKSGGPGDKRCTTKGAGHEWHLDSVTLDASKSKNNELDRR